jgi:hypothetical protein
MPAAEQKEAKTPIAITDAHNPLYLEIIPFIITSTIPHLHRPPLS